MINIVPSTDHNLLSRLIEQTPEFSGSGATELARRLGQQDALALVALAMDEPVGYKLGYQRWSDGSWYSWLGAVLPEHRGQGYAQRLLAEQESWVAARGYRSIRVKTRNRFVGMRILLARNGYELIELTRDGLDRADYRLLFEKQFRNGKTTRD